jgi:aryl-phospho-beta-D-glucosidase BglC (GH1 family)
MNIGHTQAWRKLALSIVALIASTAGATGYTAKAGLLYDPAGKEVRLHGISHFGFNSTILQPEYLWAMGWKQQIAQMKSLGFNAIRVPFVPDTLYATATVDQLSYLEPNLNADLIGKTPLQVLDLWMAEADRQGLYVLLDFHSISMQRQYPTWFVSDPADFGLVYNRQAYTVANWKRDLALVAKRYAALPHFLGIDIYNEPNGAVRWSSGDANVVNPSYFWKAAAEGAAAAVLAANPNLMIFVQGINGNFDGKENSSIPMNWGEDFQPQAYQPLAIPADKLVLSPHTYGPDVFAKSSFAAPGYPAGLAADWNVLFGQFARSTPVVVGEWGGNFGQGVGGVSDVTWQNAFVDYLVAKGMTSSFYWCYTPNSGDTGGILDGNLVVRADKMKLLARLWAAPPAPPSVVPQQAISSFVPISGAAGTVVTVNGSGFTGSTTAWLGNARGIPVTVQSDTRLTFQVPTAASTGAIGIFNASHSAFAPGVFTIAKGSTVVTIIRGGATFAQPGISSFAPNTGPVGTVVTVNGSGFTGANSAWVGAAHNAGVQVISDQQVRVTIPAGATSGAIGIFNPSHAAFTASSFTVR